MAYERLKVKCEGMARGVGRFVVSQTVDLGRLVNVWRDGGGVGQSILALNGIVLPGNDQVER